ncbi:MAG TPA: TolC family protein [Candidatus Krumholzibacteria bacterium]|nr:TolC family protein [Candidatus Krumholzibacteria bacterium]
MFPSRLRLSRAGTLCAMIAGLALAVPAFAQEPSAPVLDGTVESFVNAAIAASPMLAAARYRADATRSAAGTRGALPDPMLGFGYFISTPETRVGPQQSMWMLNQRLPFFGTLSLERKVATRTADIADRSYDRQLIELRYDVQRAFYEYYAAVKTREVLGEERDLLTRMEAVAQIRYGSGLVSQQDALKAELSLSQVEDDIQVTERRRIDAASQLNTLLNRPLTADLPAPVGADSLLTAPPADTLVAIALERRPEIQSTQIEIDRANDSRSLARRSYFPDLTLGAQYVQVGEAVMPNVADSGKDIWQVNATINIPLWIGKRTAAVDQAEADAARARSEKMSWDVRIRNEVQDAGKRVAIARDRVLLYRNSIIPQAEQTFQASEADYQTAKADFLTYLDSERMLLSVRRKYFDVVSDYGAQRAMLERAVGVPLETIE